MHVSLIAAVASNRAIGKDNDLLWTLPDDMMFFKRMTRGRHVIMGRKNWESIPHKYRPLPGRPNFVLTRNLGYEAVNATVVGTLSDALAAAEKAGETEAYVIGGAQVYALALEADLVDTMWITHVHKSYEGDAFFPVFDADRWDTETTEEHPADDRHEAAFSIVKYTRKRRASSGASDQIRTADQADQVPRSSEHLSLMTRALLLLVKGYQSAISPLLGSNCRHTPTCSAYGIEALRVWGAAKGSWLTARRISRCNPWHEPAYDPVPSRVMEGKKQ